MVSNVAHSPVRSTAARPFVMLLGVLWLVDGILQLQPKMFGHAFIDNVLAPNRGGQPAFMVDVVNFGIRMFDTNLLVTNAVAAAVQIALGLLLLVPLTSRGRRLVLWGSIVWAIIVWVFGEGAGGLLTGSASFYTGAPGAVLLFLIVAVFLLYPIHLGTARLPLAGGVLFLLGAALNAFPAFWEHGAQSMLFQASQSDTIGWVSFPARHLAPVATSAVITNIVAIGLLLLFGLLLLVRPSRPLGVIVIAFLVLVWWIPQDFGGILTFPYGTATDVDTAPLFMLLVLPLCLPSLHPLRIERAVAALTIHSPLPLGHHVQHAISGQID